jgi:hypothetical protein
MKLPNCPHLDRLGRDLIEAYRRMDDHEAFCFTTDIDNPDEVTKIHMLMAKHRNACAICQQMGRAIPQATIPQRYASR